METCTFDTDGVPTPTGTVVTSHTHTISDVPIKFVLGDRVRHGTRGEGSVTKITTQEMYVSFDIGEIRRYFWRSVFKLKILKQSSFSLKFRDPRMEQRYQNRLQEQAEKNSFAFLVTMGLMATVQIVGALFVMVPPRTTSAPSMFCHQVALMFLRLKLCAGSVSDHLREIAAFLQF